MVLQYAPKYQHNPLPKHLIYSVSQSFSISTSPIIKIVTGINNTQCKHLSKQFYWYSFLNKDWVFKCYKMQVGISKCCKLRNRSMAESWWTLGVKSLKYFSILFIWRTNKLLKIKETLQVNFFWMQVQCQYAFKKKWSLSFKTLLEDLVFWTIYLKSKVLG